MTNDGGWDQETYAATLQFPDLNDDRKADICTRTAKGVRCALSNGKEFVKLDDWQGTFSNANGWYVMNRSATLMFPVGQAANCDETPKRATPWNRLPIRTLE